MRMGAPVDYLSLEELLADDERRIRDAVREWVDRRVRPGLAEAWLEGRFPMELVPEMAALGLLGATLPEAYGGAGVSHVAYGLIMQELEAGDSGLRSFVSVQSALAMHAIYRYGSEDQRRAYLPAMARGQLIGCFGLTEPDAGSDPARMRTSAVRRDGGWVLNGTKRWITNGSIADLAVVWARDEAGVVRGFLVEKGSPGFSAPEIRTKASMRASVTSDLVLEDVVVPDDHRLPAAEGLEAALSCLTEARFGIAWGVVGAARDCYEEALAYLKERVAFGQPIAATQLAQERLVDMLSRIVRSSLVAWRLGRLKDEGRLRHQEVSLAKRDNTRAALEVARMARELLGGNGISVEYRAMRHMANLETVDTYEGTYEIHTLIVGRDITGVGAFAPSGR